MAVDLDIGNLDVRAVGGAGELLNCDGAVVDDVFGHALDEDFPDELGLGQLGAV